MNHHHVLVALHEMEGIGWKTIRRLADYFPDLAELGSLSLGQLAGLHLAPGKAELLSNGLSRDYLKRIEEAYAESPVVPIARGDEDYPVFLNETAAPPWVIYTIGRRELLRKYAVAMVGTRTPTVYGKSVASRMAEELSRSDVCIVSGMARGIDGQAHEGALKGAGSTIAVLGCGIDVIYPREHTLLYRKIAEQGLIISEYPPGIPAAQGLFPQRNRIIAGLSLGTVVVEAAARSGSLITATYAESESRDVFAVPGQITSPKSRGAHDLIRDNKAKLIASAGDILSEYKHLPGFGRNSLEAMAYTREYIPALTAEEERVAAVLADGPASIDELIERLQTNFGHLHSILLSLQLKKRIGQLPGSLYMLLS